MTDYQNMLNGSIRDVVLQASFDGRLKSAEGFLSDTGNLALLTAGSGKDLYLTKAKITMYSNSAGKWDGGCKVELKNNGDVKETTNFSADSDSGSGGTGIFSTDYNFENLFHKVEAGQVMKLEVISINAVVDVEGFIQAIEVPTGENPLEYEGE